MSRSLAFRPGAPRKVTPEYTARLIEFVRLRPRSLGLPYSLWTLARLADSMAEQTGLRVVLFRAHKWRREIAELLQALLGKHPTETIYVKMMKSS